MSGTLKRAEKIALEKIAMSLDMLRGDPTGSCIRNVYRTSPASGSFVSSGAKFEGGRCLIGSKSMGNSDGFYDLTATSTNGPSNDYFYPWLRQGVGWVKVPEDLPNGSIVMTGGMNGCTLVVSKSDGHYYFFHDGDSKYLKASDLVGDEVARVKPKDYDPIEWGEKTFRNALQDASEQNVRLVGDISYSHYVIAVKQNNRYGFYSTGMMSMNGLRKLPFAVTPCIATFA